MFFEVFAEAGSEVFGFIAPITFEVGDLIETRLLVVLIYRIGDTGITHLIAVGDDDLRHDLIDEVVGNVLVQQVLIGGVFGEVDVVFASVGGLIGYQILYTGEQAFPYNGS